MPVKLSNMFRSYGIAISGRSWGRNHFFSTYFSRINSRSASSRRVISWGKLSGNEPFHPWRAQGLGGISSYFLGNTILIYSHLFSVIGLSMALSNWTENTVAQIAWKRLGQPQSKWRLICNASRTALRLLRVKRNVLVPLNMLTPIGRWALTTVSKFNQIDIILYLSLFLSTHSLAVSTQSCRSYPNLRCPDAQPIPFSIGFPQSRSVPSGSGKVSLCHRSSLARHTRSCTTT